jgi:hypothetical protein
LLVVGLLVPALGILFAATADVDPDDRPDPHLLERAAHVLTLPSAELYDGLVTYPVTSTERTTATANATLAGGEPAVRGFTVSDALPSIGTAAGGDLGSPALSPERVRHELAGYLALGVGQIRADAPWAQIERTPGVYDWSWPDRWIPEAHALGLEVVVTFAYSPPWVTGAGGSDKVGPATAEERDAYAAAAAALVQRYPYLAALEIWNEPNHAGFWAAPDAAAYADLLRRAHGAIKAVSSTVQVLGGVLALPPPGEGVMPVPGLRPPCSRSCTPTSRGSASGSPRRATRRSRRPRPRPCRRSSTSSGSTRRRAGAGRSSGTRGARSTRTRSSTRT